MAGDLVIRNFCQVLRDLADYRGANLRGDRRPKVSQGDRRRNDNEPIVEFLLKSLSQNARQLIRELCL